MNCKKCGTPLAANAKFCPNCGEQVSSESFNNPNDASIPAGNMGDFNYIMNGNSNLESNTLNNNASNNNFNTMNYGNQNSVNNDNNMFNQNFDQSIQNANQSTSSNMMNNNQMLSQDTNQNMNVSMTNNQMPNSNNMVNPNTINSPINGSNNSNGFNVSNSKKNDNTFIIIAGILIALVVILIVSIGIKAVNKNNANSNNNKNNTTNTDNKSNQDNNGTNNTSNDKVSTYEALGYTYTIPAGLEGKIDADNNLTLFTKDESVGIVFGFTDINYDNAYNNTNLITQTLNASGIVTSNYTEVIINSIKFIAFNIILDGNYGIGYISSFNSAYSYFGFVVANKSSDYDVAMGYVADMIKGATAKSSFAPGDDKISSALDSKNFIIDKGINGAICDINSLK